jgi:hypothetical protein
MTLSGRFADESANVLLERERECCVARSWVMLECCAISLSAYIATLVGLPSFLRSRLTEGSVVVQGAHDAAQARTTLDTYMQRHAVRFAFWQTAADPILATSRRPQRSGMPGASWRPLGMPV